MIRVASFLTLLFALFAVDSLSPVFAQTSGCISQSGNYFCNTRSEAYAQAMAVPVSTCSFQPSMCLNLVEPNHNSIPQPDVYAGRYVPKWLVDFGRDGKLERLSVTNVYYSSSCPAGTEWFETEKKCLQPCQDRNAPSTEGLYGLWTPYSANRERCNSGCMYRPGVELESRDVTVCGGGTAGGQCASGGRLTRNVWTYSGDKCPVSNPPPPPPNDDDPGCTDPGAGQTYCATSDGGGCHTVPGGRTICWGPNEKGTKTDGPNTQTNSNGNQSPSPPEGSSTVSNTTVTTTANNNSSNTTINNYTTNNGGPAGSSNSGQNTDSNGKPTGGTSGSPGGSENGEDDGKENGSTGGGDCESPPVNSGDALLAQIATQTWQTRCVIDARNHEQDGQANALAGESDGLEGVELSDIYSDDQTFDLSGISETLLGGNVGTCSFSVPLQLMGKPIDLPPEFWSLAGWIGMLITAAAYLWVAHQLGG